MGLEGEPDQKNAIEDAKDEFNLRNPIESVPESLRKKAIEEIEANERPRKYPLMSTPENSLSAAAKIALIELPSPRQQPVVEKQVEREDLQNAALSFLPLGITEETAEQLAYALFTQLRLNPRRKTPRVIH